MAHKLSTCADPSEVNGKIAADRDPGLSDAGMRGVARVDVFLTANNEVVVNGSIRCGVLPISSMYQNSGGRRADWNTDLISRLIGLALERHTANNALKTTM